MAEGSSPTGKCRDKAALKEDERSTLGSCLIRTHHHENPKHKLDYTASGVSVAKGVLSVTILTVSFINSQVQSVAKTTAQMEMFI